MTGAHKERQERVLAQCLTHTRHFIPVSPLPHSSGKERTLVSAGCPALPPTRDSPVPPHPPSGAGPVLPCHHGRSSSCVTAFQACNEILVTPSALQQPRYKLPLRPGLCY